MADPKKSYNDIITWAKGTSNDIIAKQLATARTISITNNSGTALASGTFNGTGNLTLKLPATVGIDISGNAATATSATSATSAERADLVRLNGADSEYPFAICLGSRSVVASPNFHALYKVSNANSGANSGLSCIPGSDVAAGTEGRTTLIIGNGSAKSDTANRTGNLRMYGSGTFHTTIKPGDHPYNNVTLTLPATSGTIALTSDVPSNSVPSTGYNNLFTTHMGAPGQSDVKTVTNSSATLLFVLATFYYSSRSNTQATITNNGKAILDPFSVFYPGVDGSGRYPARASATFLLLKGDTLTFNITPTQMVSRVIIP